MLGLMTVLLVDGGQLQRTVGEIGSNELVRTYDAKYTAHGSPSFVSARWGPGDDIQHMFDLFGFYRERDQREAGGTI